MSQVSVDLVVRDPPGSHEPALDTRRIPTSRDDLPVISADSPCRVAGPGLPFRATGQTNRRRAMNPIDALTAAAGQWLGTNTLQDPNTGKPEETPSTATVTPVLGGRFIRVDYTWSYQGKPQEGSLLVGFDPESGEVSGHWIDTWHMGRKVLACVGATADGAISVKGSYAAPPGPD